MLNATVSVQGASLFTTLAPCAECAKLLIQAGVVAVYRRPHPEHRHRRWAESFEIAETILKEAGVETETIAATPDAPTKAAAE